MLNEDTTLSDPERQNFKLRAQFREKKEKLQGLRKECLVLQSVLDGSSFSTDRKIAEEEYNAAVAALEEADALYTERVRQYTQTLKACSSAEEKRDYLKTNIQDLLDELKQAEKELQDSKEKYGRVVQIKKKIGSVDRPQLDKLLDTLKREHTALSQQKDKLKDVIAYLLKHEEQQYRRVTDELENDINNEESVLNHFHSLSGVREVSYENHVQVLEVTQTEATPSKILISLHRAPNTGTITKVETDNAQLDLSDLSSTAVEDEATLLAEVCHRYSRYGVVDVRLAQLQRQYSLDWIPDTNEVKVLLEGPGYRIATLHLVEGTTMVDHAKLSENGKSRALCLPENMSGDVEEWIQHLLNTA